MLRSIQWIVERIAERFVPIIGSLFSSTMETFHAMGIAEQQNQLEETARQYEEQGKPEIAEALRRRAAKLGSDEPGSQGVRIVESLTSQPLIPPSTNGNESTDAPMGLPDLHQPKSKPRRKRTSPSPQDNANPS